MSVTSCKSLGVSRVENIPWREDLWSSVDLGTQVMVDLTIAERQGVQNRGYFL